MDANRFTIRTSIAALFLACSVSRAIADNHRTAPAESVTAVELYQHVATLADDAFEGRSVGSRGGYAAARYIVKELNDRGLVPAGGNGFFQSCERDGRNILAIYPGMGLDHRDEYIVVGAHYDHVGDGRQGHALGPVGKIYNGADDNASGVAVLLEIAEALAESQFETKRSILFAFWDGEEQNLIGSKHWFAAPTIPTSAVRLSITLDMVGRLRDGRLSVLGTRTGYGLRRLFAKSMQDPLWLDFSWELKANSDHWPFIEHEIPSIMLHTGLHDDYHRPTDDVVKINRAGMEQVGRYLVSTLIEAANAEYLPTYRSGFQRDTLKRQRAQEQLDAEAAAAGRWPGASPPRLGITWRTDEAEPGSILVNYVAADSPAAIAGLRLHDHIFAIDGEAFPDDATFRDRINNRLDSKVGDFTLLVESRGRVRTVTIRWPPAAKPAT